MSTLKVGALFAGYGGIELALASVVDTELAWYCEIEPAAAAILAHRYPGVPNLGDVTKVDWSEVEQVDIITGGSPCQDLSHAGKRAGMKAGTRSGLWASMCDAIDIIRPALVLWENVRGALSAEADSELEHCPGCMGDRGSQPSLRALGRVLGDLADVGYDSRWYGLRAADVGGAHGRFRIFLFATPANAGRFGGIEALKHDGRCTTAGDWSGLPHESDRDALRAGPERDMTLLPTPAVNDMGAAYTPETWDAWTDRMKAAHGNGNGHGKSLEIEAQRLLPTPVADNSRGSGTETRDLLLPTPRATDGTKGGPNQRGSSGDLMLPSAVQAAQWGDYGPAITRWENTLGRTAPAPTEATVKGGQRLSPRFVEWLMGLPDGWVTDTPGITRNQALKALGNGVVPQQCAAAFRAFLADTAREKAA